ncbi:5-formyltetrahydrofolate cyclo-ligase [Mycena maculata]|uniref:5-formyltetrahydrofolate cyclo-ligase n=1 Tax=Mycena maculata TaxID=230809 RepID=A0AAD7N1R1_9AGAR|nr:5-formyltetrahydrofolate cyclo-ligase [Mycena maculata]
MALALKAEKKILRKAVSLTLRDLSPAYVQEQSRALTARVLALSSFIHSNSVSCYLSMATGEIDTSSLVREILRSGKKLFVPKIDTKTAGRMDLLQIYDEHDLDSLPAGVWGIKEPERMHMEQPRASAKDVGLDMILVPGLAFDQSLSRLGHGKGYYDRFITAYTADSRPPPLLVGLALREQLLEKTAVPTDVHDWKMDHVVTDEGVLPRV